MNETAQQVFFGGVDPSDVRHQRASFELKVREPQVQVREHDEVYGQNNEDRLNAWRAQVANLSYNNYQDYSGVIEEIVNHILKRRLWLNHHTIKTNAFVQCEKVTHSLLLSQLNSHSSLNWQTQYWICCCVTSLDFIYLESS